MGSGAYLPLSVCGRDISPLLCPCLLHLHSQLHPLFGTELMSDYNKQGITMQDLNNLNILLDNLSKIDPKDERYLILISKKFGRFYRLALKHIKDKNEVWVSSLASASDKEAIIKRLKNKEKIEKR